jgi:multicomponent Na+:H+ antiporter subunit B
MFVVVLTGAVLLYGTADMPDWGDPNSPASLHVSPYYIEKSLEDTATPNMVTAVLADYRGYDTLGETTVIFTAGAACMLILRNRRKKRE